MASPLLPFRRALATGAADALGLSEEARAGIDRLIRVPEPEHGDLSLACFELDRTRKPEVVAEQIREALAKSDDWEKVEAVRSYVNVQISAKALAKAVIPEARSATYGRDSTGAGKTVVIDFSSPNIAKPLAFHHVRSTVIGAAIGRLLEARGYEVKGINYLGDWGKQFGLLATGFQRYGDPARRADAKHLVEVYVRANQDADVEGRKAAIAGPTRAKELLGELAKLETEAESAADAKAKKKLKKKHASLKKRINVERGLEKDADPTENVEAWMIELEAKAKRAEGELADAQAKDQEARLYFKSLEEGDPAAVANWKEFRETSIKEFERVYSRMGIEFFAFEGESHYTDVLDSIIDRVAEKPGTKISDGALIVDLEYKDGEPPVLLKTRDGTTLYLTRDIAAAIDRHDRFDFDRSLYVVAQDQALHFAQLIRTLGAMGLPWSERVEHVPFGRVHGMSTRKGAIVFLDEVLDRAVNEARAICESSEKIDREILDETAEAVGIGAVVFGDLKNLRTSDYTFRWEDAVAFDGFTGPYVQYTHARVSSIISKGGGVPESANLSLLTLPEEREVLQAIAAFPEAVVDASERYEPSIVTRAIYDLSQATARYLTAGNAAREKRILTEDGEMKKARLQLVDSIRNTLSTGLGLLGVKAPPRM